MNKVMFIGRITKELKLELSPSKKSVCKFVLAVRRNYLENGERKADFIPVETWDKTAENCVNNLRKGSLVAVSGQLRTFNYEKNGVRSYGFSIVGGEVQFLEPKKRDSLEGHNIEQIENGEFDDITPIDDGDIPF